MSQLANLTFDEIVNSNSAEIVAARNEAKKRLALEYGINPDLLGWIGLVVYEVRGQLNHVNPHINFLRKIGIEHLWHFTDIRNIDGICREGGVYSWKGLTAHGILDAHTVANDISRGCDERLGREEYVRLSFIPNSWFFHRAKDNAQLVWMCFSLDALNLGDVLYSHGNAASSDSLLQSDIRSMDINWKDVKSFSGSYSNERGPTKYPSHYQSQLDNPTLFKKEKDSWNSEILIKSFLPLTLCTGVFDANTGERIEI
jgi:hypothetical protein